MENTHAVTLNTQSEPAKTRAHDPKPGATLAVSAGSVVEAEFSFFNDSPDVAGFCLDVAGLADDWVSGAGIDCEAMAAASGGDILLLRLSPPANAALGDYEFRVRILSGGIPVGREIPLALRVQPGRASAPAAPVELVEDAPPKRTRAAVRPPVSSPPPAESSPAWEPTPVEADTAPRKTTREPEVLRAEVAASPPLPVSPPLRFRPVPPPPPPEPVERVPFLVDMDTPNEEELEGDEITGPVLEPSVLEPQDGVSLTLCPGETLLLRFAFTNDGPRERTYILDEDGALPPDWVTLVKDQVNLTRNGRGEVSLRLKPPLNADPGDYPFAVTVGPQGDALTSRLLTLAVAATPAVKLTAREMRVKIGPFGTFADFPLSVESVGNADTAFRIAVKAPPVKQGEEAKNTRGSETVYETPQWRYLFDREVDTLRSAGAGRAPRPINLRFRLQRRGAWWLGVQESHSVTVAAVPVTDAANGGKTENSVELTAIRRRLLPFPAAFALLFLIPLFLLIVVKASYLGVTNAYVANNVYYVLGTAAGGPTQLAKLRWEAPFFAFVNVSATQNGETEVHWLRHGHEEDTVSDTAYGLEKTYEVTRRKITVRFVPLKTDHKLQITQGDLDYSHRRDVPLKPLKQGVEKIGEDNVPVQSATYLLLVPRDRNVPLNLLNTTPRSSSANIQYWVVQRPDPGFFTVMDIKDNDQIGPTTAAAPLKLRATGGATSAGQELTLVTTDGGNQIVHIKLKAQ